jgi:hypothetical protein
MAAFIPGASPPEVRTPTLFMLDSIIEMFAFENLLIITSVFLKIPLKQYAAKIALFDDATKKAA